MTIERALVVVILVVMEKLADCFGEARQGMGLAGITASGEGWQMLAEPLPNNDVEG